MNDLINRVEAASGGDRERIERTRERIMRNTDPERVAKHAAEMKAWAEKIGTPKRCKVGEVHPATGECLFCGAANGQSCRLGFGG